TDSEKLSEYTQARMEEILKIARDMISQHVTLSHLSAGVVLTGGGSLLKGLQEMAQTIFDVNIAIGYPNKLKGLETQRLSPEYATAIGLVSWCCKDIKTQRKKIKVDKSLFNYVINNFKNIFSKDLF
ncbi:MAG: hypothetical protein KAI81_01945, partial [Candidatus Marinimicrobia bacterium]|nr:hypothetical protein [Candidatus Neomarinimicrobiota bacterium]